MICQYPGVSTKNNSFHIFLGSAFECRELKETPAVNSCFKHKRVLWFMYVSQFVQKTGWQDAVQWC